MKKITLIVVMLSFTILGNAKDFRKPSHNSISMKADDNTFIETLKPINEESITVENELYRNFIEISNLFEVNPGVIVIERDLKMLTLTNENIKVLQIPVTIEGSSINYVMGIYNIERSEFIIFYEEFSNVEGTVNSNVFDEKKELLYSTSVTEELFDIITNQAAPRSFKECMDAQEANFESTFTGWLYWNYVPATQLSAAINCQGCAKGWWKNAGC